MTSRPATPDDIPAIAELHARWELALLGAPEESADELRERIEGLGSMAEGSLVIIEQGELRGVGLRSRNDTMIFADPAVDAAPAYAELLEWLAAGSPAKVETLSSDQALRVVLDGSGWQHHMSSFDLVRVVDDSWQLAEPDWPAGVSVHDFRADDAEAVHHLIYVDAAWAEVPGHPFRDYGEWRGIFVNEHTVPDQQVLAWRGDRLVGVAMGRTWDDGTGWVSQLATARDERGKGLGRALLLDALTRRRNAGATALGLSVQGANRGALKLYLGVGLQIAREWMEYVPASG
jgi:mycothiol synthase